MSRIRPEARPADCLAREAMANRLPHLVITDVAMPDEDGIAFVRSIRTDDATRRIPVFALSAFHQREELQNEFDAFFKKPMDPMEIARRVADARNAEG